MPEIRYNIPSVFTCLWDIPHHPTSGSRKRKEQKVPSVQEYRRREDGYLGEKRLEMQIRLLASLSPLYPLLQSLLCCGIIEKCPFLLNSPNFHTTSPNHNNSLSPLTRGEYLSRSLSFYPRPCRLLRGLMPYAISCYTPLVESMRTLTQNA